MEEVLQTLVDGLATGSVYAISAVGLTLVYGILRLTNFAHGDMMTFGAYLAYVINVTWALPLPLGIAAAMFGTAVLAVFTEFTVWRPLRRSKAGVLQLLLMSIGLALVIRYTLLFIWGGKIRRLDVDNLSTYTVGGVTIGTQQVLVIGISIVALVAIGLLLGRTMLGRSMRALSDNFDLASSSGIDTNRVIIWTWVLSGALAGLAGVLLSTVSDLRPELGWDLLLSIFAAVILGGIGNPYGALAGGFALGISQELSTLFIEGRWKTAVGFAIMIVVLILRPQGIFGRARAVN